ncbi:MAG: RdgB/HAM1 family non-canonical purine NTP pyrophosphatase [Phycisphaerales bacterium JB065]
MTESNTQPSTGTLLIATGNPNKIEEIRAILLPLGVDAIGLNELEGDFPEPVEDRATFEANAAKKAIHYATLTGRTCIADDSGLEVDALDGRPGVYSARYAEVDGPREVRDEANNAKLLSEMETVPDYERSARFVCAIAVAHPQAGILIRTRGTFEGSIAREPRGTNGFGYDPLLRLDDGRHSAELSPEEKHAMSHRGKAVRAMVTRLEQLLKMNERLLG